MDERINKIFGVYRLEMKRIGGRIVGFPKCKDVKKTYLWRQFALFSTKMKDLDDTALSKLITIIIKYAKEHKLLNRGASILVKRDVLEICERELKREFGRSDSLIQELNRCLVFLRRHRESRSMVETLIQKRSQKSYSNITCWFKTGSISEAFIALSKNCCAALAKLDTEERKEFPRDIDLLKARHACLREMKVELKEIFGTDLQDRQ